MAKTPLNNSGYFAEDTGRGIITLTDDEGNEYIDYNPEIGFLLQDPSSGKMGVIKKETLHEFLDFCDPSFCDPSPKLVFQVKNIMGYAIKTFSTREKAEEFLRANDKGDKDLCISSEQVY